MRPTTKPAQGSITSQPAQTATDPAKLPLIEAPTLQYPPNTFITLNSLLNNLISIFEIPILVIRIEERSPPVPPRTVFTTARGGTL